MQKLNELVEQAKEMAQLHGEEWSSALCVSVTGGKEVRHHAIMSDSENDFVIDTGSDSKEASWLCDYLELCSPANIIAIAEAFRALQQEVKKNLDGALAWQRRAEAAEAKLADLSKQEPVLYALRFKNSRGEPEKLINENCLFRDREKAAAYGLGGNYVIQESGRIEWVPNPSLNPEVIPLFTRPAPAAELVPKKLTHQMGDYPVQEAAINSWNACVDAILRNIEEA